MFAQLIDKALSVFVLNRALAATTLCVAACGQGRLPEPVAPPSIEFFENFENGKRQCGETIVTEGDKAQNALKAEILPRLEKIRFALSATTALTRNFTDDQVSIDWDLTSGEYLVLDDGEFSYVRDLYVAIDIGTGDTIRASSYSLHPGYMIDFSKGILCSDLTGIEVRQEDSLIIKRFVVKNKDIEYRIEYRPDEPFAFGFSCKLRIDSPICEERRPFSVERYFELAKFEVFRDLVPRQLDEVLDDLRPDCKDLCY